jgi:hypothetical protein
MAVSLSFLDQSRYFFIQVGRLGLYPYEAEWTLFQTHCYSRNLVAPRIEPGTSKSLQSVTCLKTATIVYNRIRDTVAPFPVTVIIGLYGYEANNRIRGYAGSQ